jgi:hypothetical protein
MVQSSYFLLCSFATTEAWVKTSAIASRMAFRLLSMSDISLAIWALALSSLAFLSFAFLSSTFSSLARFGLTAWLNLCLARKGFNPLLGFRSSSISIPNDIGEEADMLGK